MDLVESGLQDRARAAEWGLATVRNESAGVEIGGVDTVSNPLDLGHHFPKSRLFTPQSYLYGRAFRGSWAPTSLDSRVLSLTLDRNGLTFCWAGLTLSRQTLGSKMLGNLTLDFQTLGNLTLDSAGLTLDFQTLGSLTLDQESNVRPKQSNVRPLAPTQVARTPHHTHFPARSSRTTPHSLSCLQDSNPAPLLSSQVALPLR